MIKKTIFLIGMTVFTLTSVMNAQNKVAPTDEAVENLKAYPARIDSLERHVIYLEKQADESLLEVELIAGKVMNVDCNRHRLIGSFQEKTVEGWGYNYTVFETENQVISTMMICPGPKTDKFVSGDSYTVRYNSRLPIVVYLPQGLELKYRIWSAGELQSAGKG